MTIRIFYKNCPDGYTPYLFVAHPSDAVLFSTNNFEPLPALSESSHAVFLSSYNHLISEIWQVNRKSSAFGFLPFSLRNTWQSSYYQGAESYARLSDLSNSVIYFTSPHWFLWVAKHMSCEVSSQDVVRARKDASVSFLQRLAARLRAVHFALSQYSTAKPIPSGIRLCFFSIWTASGIQRWVNSESDPFYSLLPRKTKNSTLVYHLESISSQQDTSSAELPVARDVSLLRLRDWVSLLSRVLLFRSFVPHIKNGPREAILDDLAATVSNQLVLALISYYAAKNIAAVNPGVKFVSLYEGNCWEQGVLQAAVEGCNEVTALQHTAFSPGTLKMRADTHAHTASHIITSGPVASSLLIQHMAHKSNDLIDGYRIRHDDTEVFNSSGRGTKILILLQGSPYDSLLLSQLSRVSLPYDVMVRCHPSQSCPVAQEFEIAQGSLGKNLQEAAIVLYNGTTAAFDALLAGVPCVYVSSGDNGRLDPLFDLDCPVKRSCYNIQMLPDVINGIVALSQESRIDAFFKAHSYIEGYFRPSNDEIEKAIIEYLENV